MNAIHSVFDQKDRADDLPQSVQGRRPLLLLQSGITFGTDHWDAQWMVDGQRVSVLVSSSLASELLQLPSQTDASER